jgi:hypothetical protein
VDDYFTAKMPQQIQRILPSVGRKTFENWKKNLDTHFFFLVAYPLLREGKRVGKKEKKQG